MDKHSSKFIKFINKKPQKIDLFSFFLLSFINARENIPGRCYMCELLTTCSITFRFFQLRSFVHHC